MTAKGDKKTVIMEAMLDLVAERGFHDAPMSLLAKRSGTGAGLIYHYFPSKEDLIHAVYEYVVQFKGEIVGQGYFAEMTPKDAFLHLWIGVHNFYRSHHREARFLDQYENSPFCTHNLGSQKKDAHQTVAPFAKAFRPKAQGGVLKNLPAQAIHELSFGVAAHLATHPKPLAHSALVQVAELCWNSVAA